jgi:hypothetical protein
MEWACGFGLRFVGVCVPVLSREWCGVWCRAVPRPSQNDPACLLPLLLPLLLLLLWNRARAAAPNCFPLLTGDPGARSSQLYMTAATLGCMPLPKRMSALRVLHRGGGDAE